jgi:alpha-galactosidase
MKIALIGQDIPMLLPTLMTDLLFAGKEPADLALEEKNPAMQDLLRGYGDAVLRKAGIGGTLAVSDSREAVLSGADCVIYAGDCQPGSRFHMDRNALGSDEENDPGLTDQARVNGGLGGLMHALRAGEEVLRLCDAMDECCPEALVINLGQPVARTTAVFLNRGYRCYGLGRTPMKGASGADTYIRRLRIPPERAEVTIAGLPGFAFLMAIRDGGKDLAGKLKKAAENNELGALSRRWLDWWGALPVGDVTDHAEFLPAQPDYIPEEKPEFGETVEKRRERILYMNTVREQGAEKREGAMAQLLLLSKAPPIRPVKLALALLRKETAVLEAVTRRNGRTLPDLPPEAVIEANLALRDGEDVTESIRLPVALAEIMTEVDAANRLAAKAAAGDREALREYMEEDPALGGLDRLYCMEVADALIRMHADVLPRLCGGEETIS